MGARDIEWRTGGAGGGAADGGRDLDATFYVPSPDGEMEPQRWWIECKGRKGTVEPDDVKSAANNSLAQAGLAYLVVVTNTTFSNPTRDWVRQWQTSHPRPRVKLWDHGSLERLLSRHPTVVLRLFSEALSPTGLLKVTEQRFWDKLEYVPVRALRTFWAARDTIGIDAPQRFALVANEFGHGDIIARPWAAQAPSEVLETLLIGLTNLTYLRLRADKVGIDEKPILAAVAHLILVSLQQYEATDIATVLLETVRGRDKKALPDQMVEMLLMPVLDRLAGEMQDVCTAGCDRMSLSDPTTLLGDENPVDTYWERVNPDGRPIGTEPRSFLMIENYTLPCKIGFPVNKDRGCPLYGVEPTLNNIAEFLAVIKRVSRFRLAEARTKMESESAKKRALADTGAAAASDQ